MKAPLNPMPITDLKLTFVELLQASREKRDVNMIHLCVSTLEYLKDAQRWQYVYSNQGGIPEFGTSEECQKYVDSELNK